MGIFAYIIIALVSLAPWVSQGEAGTPHPVEPSFDEVTVNSDQDQHQYLDYTFVEGDSLKNVLRRLRLFPIWGTNGSYQHFLNLNPEWKKDTRAENPAPVGMRVRLPIVKAPFPTKDNKNCWLVKFGELFFINPKATMTTDLHTEILNLRNLKRFQIHRDDSYPGDRSRGLASSDQSNLTANDLAQPVIKIPVRPDTPLAAKLNAMGFSIPALVKGQPYAYVEIPYQHWQQAISGRFPSSVGQIRMLDPSQTRYRLAAQVVTASRIYSITDSGGQDGDVGIAPSLGLNLGFSYRQSRWLNIETSLNYQLESFKPDDSIAIDQETDARFDFSAKNYFSLGRLGLGLGGGVLSTPSFVSTTGTQLSAKHILNPYVGVELRDSFRVSENWLAGWNVAYDQFLGAAEGPYKLDSGFRVGAAFNSRFPLTENVGLSGLVGLQYQDDKPATYQQSQIGVQVLFGLEWSLGGESQFIGGR